MTILYASPDQTVFLLDIPHSISQAQYLSHSTSSPTSSPTSNAQSIPHKRLVSSQPAQSKPFTPTEPASHKAKSKVKAKANILASLAADSEEEYQSQRRDGLVHGAASRAREKIARMWLGREWCLERTLSRQVDNHSTSQDSLSPSGDGDVSIDEFLHGLLFCWESPVISASASASTSASASPSSSVSNTTNRIVQYKCPTSNEWKVLTTPSYHNTTTYTQLLSLRHNSTEKTFLIPPQSAFSLVSLPANAPLDGPRCGFRVIVLDPPWHNRSARRKGRYATAFRSADIRRVLDGLHLSRYFADDGDGDGVYVGMWITNASSVRQIATDYFHSLGLDVIEEWIWVKCTSEGEPVLPLDGKYRQPWETFLLASSNLPKQEVTQRIMYAVPDEHSRKPCLKELIELLSKLPKRYTGLEVFARNSVSGWYAWGNQTLLFNHEAYWMDAKIT